MQGLLCSLETPTASTQRCMKDPLQSTRSSLLELSLALLLTGCSTTGLHPRSQASNHTDDTAFHPVTGSHIPISTNKTGRVYRESPGQVRAYSGDEIQQWGYSSPSEFLNKRGTLR